MHAVRVSGKKIPRSNNRLLLSSPLVELRSGVLGKLDRDPFSEVMMDSKKPKYKA